MGGDDGGDECCLECGNQQQQVVEVLKTGDEAEERLVYIRLRFCHPCGIS